MVQKLVCLGHVMAIRELRRRPGQIEKKARYSSPRRQGPRRMSGPGMGTPWLIDSRGWNGFASGVKVIEER